MSNASHEVEPPRWVWLYLPFAIFGAQFAARLAGDAAYETWMRSEISVPEIGTVVMLLSAVVLGIVLLRRRARLPARVLVPWIALFTLGCFLFAGEESSWGQSYAHWQSPEFFEKHNDQRETGFHNMSPLLDQLPRAVLTVGAIIAVLAPWLARWKPATFGRGSRLYWLLPTYVCIPAALLALLVRNVEKLAERAGDPLRNLFAMQAGEFKEYFLAFMLMVYALSLVWRTRGALER
jgi:hypothetical protein